MPPKRWAKASNLPRSPNVKAALAEYISDEIRSNNCLGMPEDEIRGMADVLIIAKTRAEVVEWTRTLMLDESFASEVIKRRVDFDLPFEGEAAANSSAPSAAFAKGKSTGRVLTIARNQKRGTGKPAPAPKKDRTSSLKPAKSECGCFARVHKLQGSCANCGRIICEEEADDVCYFCGLAPSLCVAYEIAVQVGRVTKAAQESNRESYEAAIARRDALLDHARNRVKRTTIIDDQSASLFSPQSAWMTHEERQKQEKSLSQIEREKAISQMHKHKWAYQVHIDFANQNISLGFRHTSGVEEEARPVGNQDGNCHTAGECSSESGTDLSKASFLEMETPPIIEACPEPLPSLLRKIWPDPSGLALPKGDAAELTASKDCSIKRHEEVSKRVQQDYFEEDAQLFWGEARGTQPAELIFTPQIAEGGGLLGPEEGDPAPAAAVASPPAQPSGSDVLPFAPTPLMKLRDDGVCLSMHQPWASLLVAGIKTHEGRVWKTNYRGRLWIHAATTQASNIEEVERHYAQFMPPWQVFPKHYPTRVLLGYVYLTECLDQESYKGVLPPEHCQVDSPFVFICVEPKALPFPLPMGGEHKLFKLDHKILTAAKKQLKEIS